MKFYHFGMIFTVIAVGFLWMAQLCQIKRLQQEELRRNEYGILTAAVTAAVEVAFEGAENTVTKGNLQQAEEAFFQTLSVLHDGTPDGVGRSSWKECVPCLAVLTKEGYYLYCFTKGAGFGWSELIPYDGAGIPEHFYAETEAILEKYHALHYAGEKQYRMEEAQKSIWEQGLSRACVFAVYVPPSALAEGEQTDTFLYAAAGRTRELYYVTEDKYYHVPTCLQCEKKKIVARYTSRKESAKEGAMPCAQCLK